MLKSLFALTLVPLVLSGAPPDSNPSQGAEKAYKCRQFKLSLSKPDGKDANFNVSTRTLLKKFAVSKRQVILKESELPMEQPSLGDGTKADVQVNDMDFVVVDKPVQKPFWQRPLRWIYGDKLLIFGVHMDGEMSDEKRHGSVDLSGALCSPYTPGLDETVEELGEAVVGAADQLTNDLASEEHEQGTTAPQSTVAEVEDTLQDVATNAQLPPPLQDQVVPAQSSGEGAQDKESPQDQQAPIIPLLPLVPSVQARPLGDSTDDNINMMIPREIRGIRDYSTK